MCIYIIGLFAMLRIFFIYLPFSIRYGKKYFFSIVGKSFDSVVRLLNLFFHSFMLLVENCLIFVDLPSLPVLICISRSRG